MAVQVETLEKLERRITLTLAAETINGEVNSRLKKLSRTVKADGFRPGKVPMSVVAQRYGYSVQYEVVNDRVGQAFNEAATEAQLRVAGAPRITQKEQSPEGTLSFDATFEVYPEVKIGDLGQAEIERVSTEVTEAAIDRTIEILRKQRRTFGLRAKDEAAVEGDRITIDFEGKIFPLQFPADYHGADVAGKEADFMVTVKKIEAQNLPAVDDALAKSLGTKEGTVEGLRADVKKNLEREVKFRVQARNKTAVMEALAKAAELDLPNALVASETDRLIENARADLKQRGVKDAETANIPAEIFKPQAERRVRLGLVVAELVRANNLRAKPEQLQAHIEEMSQSYEKPAEVLRWYLSDRKRMSEVEAVVIENNVAEFVLSKAKVTDKVLPFDELMTAA